MSRVLEIRVRADRRARRLDHPPDRRASPNPPHRPAAGRKLAPRSGTRPSRGWSAATSSRAPRSTSSRCGRPTRSTRNDRPRAGLGRRPRLQQRARLPARPALGAGRRRLPQADRPVPGRSPTSTRSADVRAVRQRAGTRTPSSASSARRSRACTTPAGCRAPARDVLQDPTQAATRLRRTSTGVVGRFANDKRVHAWDLWNEPDNTNGNSYGKRASRRTSRSSCCALLPKVVRLGARGRADAADHLGRVAGRLVDRRRSCRPMASSSSSNSDVISFHNYDEPPELEKRVG